MTFPVPDFPPEAIAAAKKHAVEAWPNESCGLIVAGVYVPCRNLAADPTKDFRFDRTEIVKAGKDLQAVIHSHPQGNSEPSAADMQSQIDSACIWGIIPCNKIEAFQPVFWGDFLLEESYGPDGKPLLPTINGMQREPMIGRPFIHGISDCGTLIRAWYWQTQNIRLPDFARDDAWWKSGENIYLEVFAKAGFRVVTAQEARPGDVVLGKVRSPVPNHGGILLENGLFLHHMAQRLSRREPIGAYLRYITHWLRYDGAKQI